MHGVARALVATLLLLPLLRPGRSDAIDRLEADETVSQLLVTRPSDVAPETAATRRWALLPQLGYGPDTGAVAGLKFTDRDLLDSGATLDLDGVYATEGQQSYAVTLGSPFLVDNRILLLTRAYYFLDPQREFFGLGNNDQGSDPASTNAIEDFGGWITLGWRPLERLAFDLQLGARHVRISNGKRKGNTPFTPERFPDLTGIDGGLVVPLGLSLVWNNRDDLLRPTRGWRTILKVLHANPAWGSDFELTQFIVDLGYLRSFFDDKIVLALRLNGEYIDAPDGSADIPFWELTELGGDDTLRGFFPYRFLGTSRVLLNAEVRFPIVDFDFFGLWQVDLDGVAFADSGRVFISDSDLREEFSPDDQLLSRILSDFQYDYGGGLRIKLSDALVARIDVGFSDEETALLYLEFGQTF
jgi:outer membrane protein assembly factor BamA